MRDAQFTEQWLMEQVARKHGTPRPSRQEPPGSTISLILDGQCPSGKNQVQLLWRNGKVHRYPNKTFTNWRARSYQQILAQYTPACLTRPVTLSCTYWPGDRRIRDVSGQLDAIFSLLVFAKLLKNDGLIYDCLWTRMEVSSCPKVQLDMTEWARSVDGGA